MSGNAKGPFRADHVGSLLRPVKLQQARLQRERKNITAERLREIEDESIREVVELQEDVGLEGITDGELRRDYWHLDFLTEIGGVVFRRGAQPAEMAPPGRRPARMGAARGEGPCAYHAAAFDPAQGL
ncbi:MAG: hypothetical protein ACLPX7_00070 [Xanthobacteraceae bacterium]